MIIVMHIYLIKGTITITQEVAPAPADNADKEVLFRNGTTFTHCITEINNTQKDNAKEIEVVMPMYHLIEYSKNCSKTSGSLWQYYRDESALSNPGANFHAVDNSALFKFKQKITGVTDDGDVIKELRI